MTTPTENPRLLFLYQGRRLLVGGKLGYALAHVEDKKVHETGFWLLKKAPTLGRVGLYSVEVPANKPDGSSILAATFRWVKEWFDEDQVATWGVESEAAIAEHQARKLARTTRGQEVARLVKPLARVYRGLTAPARAAFELMVLRELRVPGSMNEED